MSSARALLQLVRLPNTLTAAADVIAGAAIAGIDPLAPRTLLAALGSALLYGGGVALNDVLDVEKDRVAHPDRVLVRGALSRPLAQAVAILLLAAGVATALVAGSLHMAVTLGLLLAIVVYDVLPEGRWIGSCVMGTCRALNLARGLTLAGAFQTEALPFAAVAGHAWLILMVTAVSTFEGRAKDTTFRLALCALPLPYFIPTLAAPWFVPASAALALWVVWPGLGARPTASSVVRRAIFTLVLFDALYAATGGFPLAAVVMAGLLPLILVLARVIRQRGS
jgi:4-hydroxybenzoate polyprenyltransferase